MRLLPLAGVLVAAVVAEGGKAGTGFNVIVSEGTHGSDDG